jgi:hypothetical protein
VINKDELIPGSSYSIEMQTSNATLSRRLLSFPPDPPRDASSASKTLKWRHPRGRHDKYVVSFRDGAGDGASLAEVEVPGDWESLELTKDLLKTLERRLEQGAGDSGEGCAKSTKKQSIMAEIRTVVAPCHSGLANVSELHSEVVFIPLRCKALEFVCLFMSDPVLNLLSLILISIQLTRLSPTKAKSKTVDEWRWTPTSILGAVGVVAGAAALYYSVAKEDVVQVNSMIRWTKLKKNITNQ